MSVPTNCAIPKQRSEGYGSIDRQKKIAELRKAQGMMQDEPAEALNVSPQAISKWENGFSQTKGY
ncbi:helix-turn-helix domain-containing protein [Hydrogeniiclostridium mannosilyticum]|uniref:helix-turn-helix domain-containing protein n=1 Tax=Hydrogeniiclostridium mannosilyticum TaxID=2764322 RepID=UPI0021D13FEB|nr:helix-turn-helix transcriptional regulator [Hydrogeniiclostridium mannosilyticum]